MTKQPLLAVKNLDIAFSTYGRRHHILKDISFEIGKGERVALIGETGSGKSVTSKAILGTLPDNARIERGSIEFEGRSILDMRSREREALKGTAFSIIMQDPLSSFNPVFRIGRHLDDVMYYADRRDGLASSRSERRQRIFDVLRRVQLQDPERVFEAYPAQLSGGMRQRVLIGLALLHQPQLLIADEPGTALDVTTQDEILKLINRLVDSEGLSLLMITHNLGVVRQTADRVLVMRQGEIVESGNLHQIFGAPRQKYTVDLIDAIPLLYGPKVFDQPLSQKPPIITVKGAGKTYVLKPFLGAGKAYEAVKPVTFSVSEGEIFGLAGESGSGKTSIARMIMGLIAPSCGTIEISTGAGQPPAQRLTQIVYQNPGTSLNPKRTAAQTLSVPLAHVGLRGKAATKRMEELMALVNLPSAYLSKYPHELSGGQKQRVAIARALAAEPKIIVLDEPTSALDVSVQKQVIALLQKLKDELGLTYLFISHDLSLMRNFCSRIAIMLKGEIVEQGRTADVFADPRHPYTRALISAIPVMSDEEEALKPTVSAEERGRFLVKTTA
ncbi:ABC transporter ATP-binding protein [Sinorhizobium sp. GL28]|uniref:ATP-binding cassette domain-containing protein n=1 Tax=Sinorhizobium sp. GL28 TaxID=1358418 RepID=UPI00071C9F88|nr:ABC transporter ATP-binding protein [Sinorhizobium sp. GL28]KSV95157.1 hypothetical protein N184_35425 [Sinorhizobium sp. GL28]